MSRAREEATPGARGYRAAAVARVRALDPRTAGTWRLGQVAVLLLVAALAARTAAGTVAGWISYGRLQLQLTDFVLYYASALQGLRFGWHHLYDLAPQHQVLASMGSGIRFFPNVYTPVMTWLVTPLTALDPPAAYAVWSGLLAAALVTAWWVLAPGRPLLKAILLLAPMCLYLFRLGLQLGQVNVLQMAALALAVVLLRHRHDWWAGLPLAVVALHPQGIELVPFALLASGRWRTFATWTAAMAALAVAVVGVTGVDGAQAYAHRLLYADAHPVVFWVGPWYTLPLQAPPGSGRLLIEGIAAGAALFVAWRQRGAGPEIPIVAGILGSLLSSPFLHLDDLMWLVPAAWLVVSAGARAWEWALLLAAYVAALQCTNLGVVSWGRYLLALEVVWLLALAVLRPAPVGSRRTRGIETPPREREATITT